MLTERMTVHVQDNWGNTVHFSTGAQKPIGQVFFQYARIKQLNPQVLQFTAPDDGTCLDEEMSIAEMAKAHGLVVYVRVVK